MLAPPGLAVSDPPHVLTTAGTAGFALKRFAGRLSLNETAESATAGFGLVSVNVSTLFAFTCTDAGANAAAIDGGTSACNVALAEPDAVALVPLSVVVRKPLTFACVPAVVGVTL